MSGFEQNQLQELLIIEMKDIKPSSTSNTQNSRKLCKSFTYNKQRSSDNITHYENYDSNNSIDDEFYTRTDKHRYTDGYFFDKSQEDIIEQKKKQFLKLSLIGLDGCGIAPVDEKKISILEQDTYRRFNTGYIKTGYGFFADFFYLLWNLFMNQFTNMMQYFGKIIGKLEQKYGAANVGYAMMAVSTLLHLVPTLYVKLNPQLDFSVTLMARGLIAMILLYCMGTANNQPLIKFCYHDMKILILRGFLTAISQLYFFLAIKKIPLSINYVIQNTGPIFVFILSSIFFSVSIKKKEIVGILISVVGVLCLTNPEIVLSLFSSSENQLKTDQSSVSTAHVPSKFQYVEGNERLFMVVIFVILYIGWAYGIIIVKKVKEANTLGMNFYVAVAFLLSGAISFFARNQSISHLTIWDFVGLVFIVGLFCFGSQYTFITSTFLNKNHGPLSMLNYLSVVESYIVQILFFNEIPSFIEIQGSLLVLAGLGTILIKL